MKEEIRLTPEQALKQIELAHATFLEALKKEDEASTESPKILEKVEKATDETIHNFVHILISFADEPNAEEIYTFILSNDAKKDDTILSDPDLAHIGETITDKPYAEKVLMAVMNHPEFIGFEEKIQMALLPNTALLEEYWKKGYRLHNNAELAIFTLPNWKKLLTKYLFSYGHGLCDEAQKKIFALPQKQALKWATEFINGITEENHYRRVLCNNGLFLLLKNKPLFDLYVEKMAPFYEKKEDIFPKPIALVAKRKG